jgi:hypothetical protein
MISVTGPALARSVAAVHEAGELADERQDS